MEEWRKIFIQRMAELKKTDGLTQAQLAEKLNVSQGTVANWARGANEPRGRKQYQQLEKAIKLPAGSLIGQPDTINETPAQYTADKTSDQINQEAVIKATDFICEKIGPTAMAAAGARLCAQDIIFLYNLFDDPGADYLKADTILKSLKTYQFIK